MPITPYALSNAEGLAIRPSRLEHADKMVQRWVDENTYPSFTTRVYRKGKAIYEGAWGAAAPGGAPLQMDAIFPVASVTKPIIAALIMALQEDGMLDIGWQVDRYLPQFTGGGREEVHVWHLLTHTCGLDENKVDDEMKAYVREHYGLEGPEEDSYEAWKAFAKLVREKMQLPPIEDEDEMADDTFNAISSKLPLHYKPQEKMLYCNTGYQLLGKIVEKLSGGSLDAFAQERLFGPLGMVDSHWVLPKEKFGRVVVRAEGTMGYPWYNEEHSHTSESASGGLKSTTHDLIRFGLMLRGMGTLDGAQVLSPASVRQMMTNHNTAIPEPYSAWGLGLNVRANKIDASGALRSPSSVEHGGYGGSSFIYDPEYDCIFATLSVDWEKNGAYSRLSNYADIIYSSFNE